MIYLSNRAVNRLRRGAQDLHHPQKFNFRVLKDAWKLSSRISGESLWSEPETILWLYCRNLTRPLWGLPHSKCTSGTYMRPSTLSISRFSVHQSQHFLFLNVFFLFIENNFCIQIVFLILFSPPSPPLRFFPHLYSRISYNLFIIFLTAWLLLYSPYTASFEFSSFFPIKSSLFPNYSWRSAFPELSLPTRDHIAEERWLSFLQKGCNRSGGAETPAPGHPHG